MSQAQPVRPNAGTTTISSLAAAALSWSPTAWLKSWLLYLGIQTHVRSTIDPELKPLHNVCEYLNAVHVYADEARQGVVRTVDSHHFCSHVSKDLRQCLIYARNTPTSPLIGIEYMIPRHRFLALPASEQALWHSHTHEVLSGMLVLPYPSTHPPSDPAAKKAWDDLETQALSEVVGWYGKTYHFIEVDKGEELPLGGPKLMGSLTGWEQGDVDALMGGRDRRMGVSTSGKRGLREGLRVEVEGSEAHGEGDSWWKEARRERRGIYASVEGERSG